MAEHPRAWVRATCPRCGTVEVAVADAELVLARPDLDGERRNAVEFSCPTCGTPGSQRVDDRTTRLVTDAGVALVAARPDAARPRRSEPAAPD